MGIFLAFLETVLEETMVFCLEGDASTGSPFVYAKAGSSSGTVIVDLEPISRFEPNGEPSPMSCCPFVYARAGSSSGTVIVNVSTISRFEPNGPIPTPTGGGDSPPLFFKSLRVFL